MPSCKSVGLAVGAAGAVAAAAGVIYFYKDCAWKQLLRYYGVPCYLAYSLSPHIDEAVGRVLSPQRVSSPRRVSPHGLPSPQHALGNVRTVHRRLGCAGRQRTEVGQAPSLDRGATEGEEQEASRSRAGSPALQSPASPIARHSPAHLHKTLVASRAPESQCSSKSPIECASPSSTGEDIAVISNWKRGRTLALRRQSSINELAPLPLGLSPSHGCHVDREASQGMSPLQLQPGGLATTSPSAGRRSKVDTLKSGVRATLRRRESLSMCRRLAMDSPCQGSPLPRNPTAAGPPQTPCTPGLHSDASPMHHNGTTPTHYNVGSPAQRIKAFCDGEENMPVADSSPRYEKDHMVNFRARQGRRRNSSINPSAPLPLGLFSPQPL